MVDETERVQKLVAWVTRNIRVTSAMFEPVPTFEINAHSLLDSVSEIWQINKETIGKWVDKENTDE